LRAQFRDISRFKLCLQNKAFVHFHAEENAALSACARACSKFDCADVGARFPRRIRRAADHLGLKNRVSGRLRNAGRNEWSFFRKHIQDKGLQGNLATGRVLFVQHPFKNGLAPPV
jgi:hypothetical protein